MLTLGRLATRVWENPKLTTKTKMAVYDACVVSTLLYVSEAWKTYSKQERKLNIVSTCKASAASSVSAGETRCPTMRSWTAPVSPPCTHYSDSAECAGLAMCAMEDDRIPKDILYGELAVGKRPRGHPQLRYKDVCKRDMRALEIDPKSWEDIAADRSSWRCLLHKQLKEGEEKITNEAIEKRTRRK